MRPETALETVDTFTILLYDVPGANVPTSPSEHIVLYDTLKLGTSTPTVAAIVKVIGQDLARRRLLVTWFDDLILPQGPPSTLVQADVLVAPIGFALQIPATVSAPEPTDPGVPARTPRSARGRRPATRAAPTPRPDSSAAARHDPRASPSGAYGRPILTRPGRLAETLRTLRPGRGASMILPLPT